MFHIRKQILILDNNNPSKYKLQFLNDDVIYLEGKKTYPNPPGPMWEEEAIFGFNM